MDQVIMHVFTFMRCWHIIFQFLLLTHLPTSMTILIFPIGHHLHLPFTLMFCVSEIIC